MNKLLLAIYYSTALFYWQFIFDCAYHAAHWISKLSNAALRNIEALADAVDENFPDENS